jgi:hypothetical protein
VEVECQVFPVPEMSIALASEPFPGSVEGVSQFRFDGTFPVDKDFLLVREVVGSALPWSGLPC